MSDVVLTAVLDSSQFRNGAAEMNKSLDGVKGKVKEFSKELLALAGIVGGGAFFMKAIEETRNAELAQIRLTSQIRALGKEAKITADRVFEVAEAMSKLTGFDDDKFVEVAAMLNRLGVASDGNIASLLKLVAQISIATGSMDDMQQSARALAMALQNPGEGTMMLRRMGLVTSSLADQAKKLSEAGDKAAAYDLIVKNLGKTLGDLLPDYAKTLDKSIRATTTAFEDFAKAVGGSARGEISEFYNYIQSVFAQNEDLAKDIGQVFGQLVAGLKVVLQIVTPIFTTILSFLTNTISAIASMVDWVWQLSQALGSLATFDWQGFKQNASEAGQAWMRAGESLGNALPDAYNAAINSMGPFAQGAEDLNGVLGDQNKMAGDLAGTLSDELTSAYSDLRRELMPLLAAQEDFEKAQKLIAKAAPNEAEKVAMLSLLKDKYEDLLDPLEAVNKELDKEYRGLFLTSKQLEVQNKLEEYQNRLKKAGIDLSRSQLNEMQKRIEAWADEKEKIEEIQREQERYEELLQQPFENAITNIQSAFSDQFEKIFSGGIDSFKDLANAAKSIFIKLAAEIATLMVFSPQLITGIFGGSSGAAGTAGSSGGGFSMSNLSSVGSLFSSGSINNFGASLGFGYGADFIGPMPAGTFTSASLSGVLSAAGIGALGGGLLASLTGGNAMGGTIGGGLGAGAGMIIGGPVGAVIGGLLGGGVGGLFGPGKSVGPNAGSAFTVRNGMLGARAGVSDNGGDAAGAQSLVASIADIINTTMSSLGGGINSAIHTEVSNYKGMYWVGSEYGKGSNYGTADEAAAAAIKRVFNNMDSYGLTSDMTAALRRLTGSSTAELGEQIDIIVAYFEAIKDAEPALTETESVIKTIQENFEKMKESATSLGLALQPLQEAYDRQFQTLRENYMNNIEDQILAIEDPKAYALKQLDAAFDNIRKDATALGIDLVRIEYLYGLQRVKINEQFAEDTTEAIQKQYTGLKDWLDKQMLGSTSSLSIADKLVAAQNQFADLVNRARGGDQDALRGVTGVADSVLNIGRDYYASTEAYTNLEAYIRETVANLGHQLGLPGFASGGSFLVGGAGATDSKIVAFRATPGERVTIDQPGMGRDSAVVSAIMMQTKELASQMQSQAAAIERMQRELAKDQKERRYAGV